MARPLGSCRARRRATATAVATMTVLLAAGCSSNANGITLETPPALPSPTTAGPVHASPSPNSVRSPTPTKEQEQVLAQYRRFTDAIIDVQKVPAEQRPAALRMVTTDPLYTAAIKAFAEQDKKGLVPYGKSTRSPVVQSVRPRSVSSA